MAPADGEGGGEVAGRVTYTTKELLERLDHKLDAIDAKLDKKADRERVHALGNAIIATEGRMTSALQAFDRRITLLEQTTVKREGPIIDDIREFEQKVASLESEVRRSADVNRAIASDRTARFTRFEKVLAMIVAMSALALQVALRVHFGG